MSRLTIKNTFIKRHIIHLETITQIVLGNIIALVILHWFGMDLQQSLQLQLIFFVTSYIRSYCVRKVFSKLNNQQAK